MKNCRNCTLKKYLEEVTNMSKARQQALIDMSSEGSINQQKTLKERSNENQRNKKRLHTSIFISICCRLFDNAIVLVTLRRLTLTNGSGIFNPLSIT